MSRAAINWSNRVEGLYRAEKAVLMILADLADSRGQLIKTVEKIASKGGVSVRTVQRGIVSLEERGVIARVFRRSAKGRQAPCLITLNFDVIQGDKKAPANDETRVSECHPGQGVKLSPLVSIYITPHSSAVSETPFSPSKGEPDYQAENDNVIAFPLAGGMR